MEINDLKEKIDLFNYFTKEEKQRLIEKHITCLGLVSYDDLCSALNFLEREGIRITKAKEVKVLVNSLKTLESKIGIINEAHEIELYRQDPNMVNRDAMDLWKKFQYFIQRNIEYRNIDGTYKISLLKDETKLNDDIDQVNTFNSGSVSVNIPEEPKEEKESVIDFSKYMENDNHNETFKEEPKIENSIDNNIINFDLNDIKPSENKTSETNPNIVDINEYRNNLENDMKSLEEKTATFNGIKEDLKKIRNELEGSFNFDVSPSSDNIDNPDNMISFDSLIQPEDYNIRGGRAA